MNNLIILENVTKVYGSNVALNNVSLTLEPGYIYGLLGPNGSGKTTLLKLLLHIIRPNNGKININNENISYLTRQYISYMPDREYLYDTMTVKEAISYYVDMFTDFDFEKAENLCKELGLNKEQKIKELSKGTKEKVNLMLTLSRNTKIYLLDEPLGSLDPVIKHEMLSAIKSSIKPENIILMATHLIKDTEEIIDKVIFLKNGNIAAENDMKSIKKDYKSLDDYYLEVFKNA